VLEGVLGTVWDCVGVCCAVWLLVGVDRELCVLVDVGGCVRVDVAEMLAEADAVALPDDVGDSEGEGGFVGVCDCDGVPDGVVLGDGVRLGVPVVVPVCVPVDVGLAVCDGDAVLEPVFDGDGVCVGERVCVGVCDADAEGNCGGTTTARYTCGGPGGKRCGHARGPVKGGETRVEAMRTSAHRKYRE